MPFVFRFSAGVLRESVLKPFPGSRKPCTWTEWVTKTMDKSRRALFRGIPAHADDLKHVNDLSLYADYCTRDVFNSFKARPVTASIFNTRGLKKHGLSEDKLDQYRHLISGVVAPPAVGSSTENVSRIPTSFPLSFAHDGSTTIADLSLDPDVSRANVITRESDCTDETYRSLTKLRSEENVFAHAGNGSSPDPEKKGYLLYNKVPAAYFSAAERSTAYPWHESYKFLMMVCAWRVKSTTHELQLCVEYVEDSVFCHQIAESERKFVDKVFRN